jgi:transposase
MFHIAQGSSTVSGIARETEYARQSIQRSPNSATGSRWGRARNTRRDPAPDGPL